MVKPLQRFLSYRASEDPSLVRTEQFEGRDFLVVPVIALVQGVLQGMTAEEPELALAEEFGRVPASWDGRPVVMNHPVVDGQPVSANSPTMLESIQFGWMFNTSVGEDLKLRSEAWLDLDKVAALGGEIESTVARIQAGELVEVSTGLYTGVEVTTGEYGGREYSGIWRNIMPDHLAFLSEGKLGACSAEDGCGTPRINSAPHAKEYYFQEASMPNSTPTRENTITRTLVAPTVVASSVSTSDCGCTKINVNKPKVVVVAPVMEINNKPLAPFVQNVPMLMVNSYPGAMTDGDVRTLLNQALEDAGIPGDYWYIVAFTQTDIIYSCYMGYDNGYCTMQRGYTIGDDKSVTLAADAIEVNVLTQIVPVSKVTIATTPAAEPTLAVSQANSTGENPMSVDNTAAASTSAANTTPSTTEAIPTSIPQATVPAPSGTTTLEANAHPVKVRTMAEYIAEAPPEMQEVLQSGLRLHSEKKSNAIKALQATGRCKFNETQLNGMNLDMLENLMELAKVPQFEGLASPRVNEGTSEDYKVPTAPKLNWSGKVEGSTTSGEQPNSGVPAPQRMN